MHHRPRKSSIRQQTRRVFDAESAALRMKVTPLGRRSLALNPYDERQAAVRLQRAPA
jgi:hypothetical protein